MHYPKLLQRVRLAQTFMTPAPWALIGVWIYVPIELTRRFGADLPYPGADATLMSFMRLSTYACMGVSMFWFGCLVARLLVRDFTVWRNSLVYVSAIAILYVLNGSNLLTFPAYCGCG